MTYKVFFLHVEIKSHNVMIDGQNFLDEPVKNNIRSSEDIITFEI